MLAQGIFSDGTRQRLAFELVWSVTPSNGSIATVTSGGVVTGVAAGTATVKVELGTDSATATVNVQNYSSVTAARTGPPNPQTVVVTGLSTIAVGTATPFVATATLEDGTTQDVTSDVIWTSRNPAIALVGDALGIYGWVWGVAPGDDTIGAVFNGQAVTMKLTVSSATLTSIAITPAAPQSKAVDRTVSYRATGTFSDSTTQDLTYLVTWTSSDVTVAFIDIYGTATTLGTGSTMVKATADIDGVTASDDKALIVTP